MTDNFPPPKQNSLWHLVSALQKVAGGGVCKKVTLVAYFDAHGNCITREQIQVVKLYPNSFFRVLAKAMDSEDESK